MSAKAIPFFCLRAKLRFRSSRIVPAVTSDEFKLPFSPRISRFISDSKSFFLAMSKEAGNYAALQIRNRSGASREGYSQFLGEFQI